MSESIICKVVVSPSAYDLIPGFLNECKCSLIVTTLGVAEAIKKGLDVDGILESCSVMAFSHKVPKNDVLPLSEWEALLLAKDLGLPLLAKDLHIIEEAKRLAIEVWSSC
jgi:hypothetical protein